MIRLLVLDVDGTMTDGGVYYDATGNELKKFAIKDGAGLVLARTAGIRTVICTGRESAAVRRRAADLKITDVYQNVSDKAAFLRDFMQQNGCDAQEVAYCGDDYGVGGNDHDVYESDVRFITIDNYLDFGKRMAENRML